MNFGQAPRPTSQNPPGKGLPAGRIASKGGRIASSGMSRTPLGESLQGNASVGIPRDLPDPNNTGKGERRRNVAAAVRSADSTTANAGAPQRVAALARRPRVSAVGLPGAAAPSAALSPAIRVDSTSFEEWMKMATDNKINSTNTWNFALIDYFHDMSLLRNDSGDGSINFQKASCTLDGCIKVWTSRVDSVVVETGRLLNGLQDDLNAGKEKGKRGKGEEGDDEDIEDGTGDEDDDGGGVGGKKRKRSKAKESTLAKDFSQIQIKKLDLEFTVDPLFKKTSADFDEGGAGGLLMNHLGVDHNARIVFDAGDAVGIADDEDPGMAEIADESYDGADDAAGAAAAAGPVAGLNAPIEMIDIGRLRAKLCGSEDVVETDTLAQMLARRTICPTFASFRFSKDDISLFDDLAGGANADDTFDSAGDGGLSFGGSGVGYDQLAQLEDMPDFGEADGEMDFFADAGPGTNGLSATDYAADNFDDMGDDYGMETVAAGTGGHGRLGDSMVPNRNGPDLFMALGDIRAAADGEDGNGLFDYFDQRLAKNWAGPEHWKMRRALPTGNKENPAGLGDAERVKGSKKIKEPFVIDFLSEEGAISTKELFEADSRGASINLPKRPKSTKADLYLLPEDRHFNSKQLLRLFSKPRMALNIRRHGDRLLMQDMPQADEVDQDFWAQAAATREGADGPDFDDSMSTSAAPYETQSQYDYNDELPPMEDGGPISFGNATQEVDMDESELMGQTLRKVKPEYVNYAKKAKRVDIRKLKETIWKELAIPRSCSASDTDGESGPPTPQDEPRTFLDVVSGLRKTYPKDKMEEISTSFCFICLLHLANEEGLSLSASIGPQGSSGEDSFASRTAALDLSSGNAFEHMAKAGLGITSNDVDDALGGEDAADGAERIGALEWVRIEKDPNAGRSA
ncbi:hypothetical protein K437DRAFT_255223 [Tilletiaria anomala UBC 951]|uniref:Condensin complex subunit 2 n=1 Tax=Tilletiaria anomala (strain ATCC 24038 / CBS 436.72 / UBC 951) TaxID=1037660 RepID=A0A066WAH4_TILAU|nr:uncharacterized protein K437DRAFT_255223 [Tilletiaria anomala UBC 951]KDN49553.1 hypothetical protein K437DRAFT_255223 [Tilletiaria anomala UBC 951]